MKNLTLLIILCLVSSCSTLTVHQDQVRRTANTNSSDFCNNSISSVQMRDEIVNSLTSLETRIDEVSVLKINSVDVRTENKRKLLTVHYTLILREPSHLSKSITLDDPKRMNLQITINANLACESQATSSKSILIDGKQYNDLQEDDREGLAESNEANKTSLQLSE